MSWGGYRGGHEKSSQVPVPVRRPVPSVPTDYESFARGFLEGPPGKIFMLYGDPIVFRFSLALASRMVLHEVPIAVIDGCNRFDAHSIARYARERGASPDAVLRRIFVSRGFTCYQMEAAVSDRLLPFIRQIGGHVGFVFGLLDTFFDEQVPQREVRAILRRIVGRLGEMKSDGVSLLLTSRFWHVAPQGRNALFPMLKAASDRIYRIDLNETMQPKLFLEHARREADNGTHNTDIHQYHRFGNRRLVEVPPRTPEGGPGGVR